MTLALTARLNFDPKGILTNSWIHDMAHAFVYARAVAVRSGLHQTPPARRLQPRRARGRGYSVRTR